MVGVKIMFSFNCLDFTVFMSMLLNLKVDLAQPNPGTRKFKIPLNFNTKVCQALLGTETGRFEN